MKYLENYTEFTDEKPTAQSLSEAGGVHRTEVNEDDEKEITPEEAKKAGKKSDTKLKCERGKEVNPINAKQKSEQVKSYEKFSN